MNDSFGFGVSNDLGQLSVAEKALVTGGQLTSTQMLQNSLQLYRDGVYPPPVLTNDGKGTAYLEFWFGESYTFSPDGSLTASLPAELSPIVETPPSGS
jgi:hypothetical protein